MERKIEYGRHPELLHLNRNIPRGNHGDELRHLERGRGSCDRIPFHTGIIDQEDQNSRRQSPDPTVVVRCDDITPTPPAKIRRKTQRGNTRPGGGRVARGGLGDNHAPGDQRNIGEILNLTRHQTTTRTSHATEGIQWVRMEELGKALTNRCRAVRELPNKKHKKQEETRDRNTNRRTAQIRMSTQNAHTRPHLRTFQSGSVIITKTAPIIDNQPRFITTSGRHVA